MNRNLFAPVVSVAFVAVISLTLLYSPSSPDFDHSGEVDTFESEAEFQSFIAASGSAATSADYSTEDVAEGTSELGERDYLQEDSTAGEDAELDIVEPELVVEDGESIYYSSHYPEHLHVVDTDLDLEFNESEIGGQLLLHDDIVVSVNDDVTAYGKSDMEEEWSLGAESRIETVRQAGDELTVVTRDRVDERSPCPIRPASGVEIACSGILYHPGSSADYTYNIMKVNIETGEVRETTAFTADRGTEVEVTPGEIYVSYSERVPESEVMIEMLLGSNIPDSELRDRLEEIDSYELSERSRQIEIQEAVEQLAVRQGEEVMEDLEGEAESFDRENMRDYETSHVLKFDSELEQEELQLEGRVTDIQDTDESVVVVSEVRGMSYSNRERDIHRLEGFDVAETRQDYEDRIRSIENLDEGLLVRTSNGLEKLDNGLETTETYDKRIRGLQVHGDTVVVASREGVTEAEERELMQDDVPVEELRESRIEVLTSDLDTVHSEVLDSEYIYRLGDPVEIGDRLVMPVSGREATLLEIDEGIEFVETEANGQLLRIDDALYFIERNSIVKKDLDYSRVDSIELHRERDRRHVEPMPEPR